MKLTFLGTAAAEGLPAVFCNCPACKRAKELKGKDIRTRSQIMVGADLLIDFPMDSYMHALNNNLDLSAIKYIFITHAHMDHCYPQDISMRGAEYAKNLSAERLNIFGNKTVMELFARQSTETKPEVLKNLSLHAISPYETAEAAPYRVTALPAVHTVGEECLVYLVQEGEKSALILNDTGILDYSFYTRLSDILNGSKLSVISFDCTYGQAEKGAGRHMGLIDNYNQIRLMNRASCIDNNTVLIATHFSHNGAMTHGQLEAAAKQYGIIAAYDGMTVEV